MSSVRSSEIAFFIRLLWALLREGLGQSYIHEAMGRTSRSSSRVAAAADSAPAKETAKQVPVAAGKTKAKKNTATGTKKSAPNKDAVSNKKDVSTGIVSVTIEACKQ